MKTLVNKNNPAIRITAPEIEVHEEEDMYFIPVSDYCIPMCIEDWILVEEEPEKDGVRKLREDLTSYCISQIKNPTTAVTESGFKVERARRDAYADIDEHFGILAENLPDEIEEEPGDLEKAADDYVMQTASGTAEEMETLTDAFKAGAEWAMHYQEKKIADAYEKGKQEGIRVVRSWESSPGQGGY